MTHGLQLLAITGVLALSVVSPGPNFAIVTATAMGVSRRAGLLAGAGLAAASCTWALLAVAGIGLLLAQVPWVHAAVRIGGAAYLIWRGVEMILDARKPVAAAGRRPIGGAAAMRKAYAVSMTNPKSLAFYGSIFTVMVPAAAPAWFYAATVLIATSVSAAWYCGLALAFSQGPARRLFARAKAGIEATMGVVLVVMGGRLLLDR